MKTTIRKLMALSLTLLALTARGFAQEIERVETVQDENGWRLQVEGRDFPIKGVVWAYTPIGENYSYDLWSQSDDFIERMIDTDMELLRKMGVNTIRCFSMIPPRWVEYIYDRHGIYTMVNDLFGRYGLTVNGKWMAKTDYSDPAVRRVLLEQYRKTVMDYKDRRGVLLFMLGNESNYGLEWESDAIENLPSGERLEAKARYLYSLFGEAIALHKELDPAHPVGIVNGDLQYLAIIKEEASNLDILGVNSYRGKKAYDLFYSSVAEELDRPIIYTEIGADAYNVAWEQEDQIAQADIVRAQVEEMYYQSWGKGRSANVLGAYIFEWIDEWWKHGMEVGLDVHDTTGTWNNGAYEFDAVSGKQNMNEEWFGLVAQSTVKENDLNKRLPRAAYYTLQEIWRLDPIWASAEEIRSHFAGIDPAALAVRPIGHSLANRADENKLIEVGGSLSARGFMGWTDQTMTDLETMKANANFRRVETAALAFAWKPAEALSAGLALRLFGSKFYPSSTTPVSFLPQPVEAARLKTDTTPVEIYSAWAEYEDELLEADFYYHTGHPDWYLEGDFFALLPEAFDTYTMDKDGSRAPFGLEIRPKAALQGLTVYAGPELYYGGFPMAMIKYYREFGKVAVGAIHQEELAYPQNFSIGGYSNVQAKEIRPLTRATSLSASGDFLPLLKAHAGVLFSRPEQIGNTYTMAETAPEGQGYSGSPWYIYENQRITALDALAFKLRLETHALPYTQLYLQGLYAGAVSDSKAMLNRAGSQIADIGTGNRMEAETGALVTWGNLSVAPKFNYRKPLINALPDITGVAPLTDITSRSFLDPFHVWANREKIQAEIVMAWDPTGATWFFDWNNDDRENARLAGSLSFLYNFYEGPTDAKEFISSSGTTYIWEKGGTAPDGSILQTSGLPAVNGTWSAVARLVTQPLPGWKMIATGDAGRGQSTSIPDGKLVTYAGANLKVLANRFLLEGGARLDGWGSEQWYREFNLTYPLQWNIGLAYGFEKISFLNQDNRAGIMITGQTLDRYSSPNNENPAAEPIKQRLEIQAYVNLSF